MLPTIVSWKPNFVSLDSNVFSQLFRNRQDAKEKMKLTTTLYQENLYNINKAIEDTTLITLDRDSKRSLVFLPILAEANKGQSWLDLGLLDAALFQRLLYRNIHRVGQIGGHSESGASEPKPFVYLFHCYLRLKKILEAEKEVLTVTYLFKIKEILMRNTLTTLKMPELFGDDLYETDSLGDQIWKLLKEEHGSDLVDFLNEAMEKMTEAGSQGKQPSNVLKDLFDKIWKETSKFTLSNIMNVCETLELVALVASKKQLGTEMTKYSFPADRKSGKAWESTLLGSLLRVSVLPKRGSKPEFFTVNAASMLTSDYKINEQNAFSNCELLFGYVFRIWENLLKGGSESKHIALEWIGQCLQANQGKRGEMANQGGVENLYSSTAFFINIGKLLLEFSNRFMKEPLLAKMVKVSAHYFKTKKEPLIGNHAKCCEKGGMGIHLEGFESETTLVADDQSIKEANEDAQGILSDFFFMTHVALDLGMNQAHKDMKKISDEIGKVRECEQIMKSSNGQKEVFLKTVIITEDGPIFIQKLIRNEEELKVIRNSLYTQHSCLRTAMMNPKMRENLNTIINCSTIWLLYQCGDSSVEVKDNNASISLSSEVLSKLSDIPEFIFENIYNFLNLENTRPVYGKHKQKMFSGGIQSNILKLLTVFMRTNWVKNPHLRAKFAKALSLLLPEVNNREDIYRSAALLQPSVDSPLLQPQAVEEADNLFDNISCKKELVLAIMKVYVSLEVTGESLQFEQKFSYRFPINFVLFYLLKIKAYRDIILEIASEAHEDMANQQPPIFLRFVNGMINDGTWLLDESLNSMTKIRKVEDEMVSSSWESLPSEIKEQRLDDLKNSKKFTRNTNLLSNDVIRMLEALSKLTTQVFTHPDMADRIAAMLNYFMQNLTGKDRKQYKVKDPNDLFFNPLQLLKSLNHIYCSFSKEKSFIYAVSQDGRSYKPELFEEACKVLRRYEDVEDLEKLAMSVKEEANKTDTEADITTEAPDEFLDPIMSTLMKEPVILPSSGKVVDRSTIAKHLLSDETDPFNRQPLTMDMVKPDLVLKAKIQKWIKEQTDPSHEENDILHNNASLSRQTEESETNFSGGHSVGGSKLLPRIRRDLAEIYKQNIEGLFVEPDEEDMTKIHVLMTGPEGTPYFGGFFYFIIQCPPSYPAAPPKVLFLTTDGGRVRFNPNLYRNGRVCLSVLGTTSGPGWTPALSLLSVLLTIRSILNEHPYHNIPETELERTPGDSERYNIIIKHETIRVALIQFLNSPPQVMPEHFYEKIKNLTRANVNKLLENIEEFKHLSGKEMKNDWLEIKAIFQWDKLESDLKKWSIKLSKEESKEPNNNNPDSQSQADPPKSLEKRDVPKTGEKSKQNSTGGHSFGGGRLLPRIRKDLAEIMNEAPPGMFVVPDEADMTKIHAIITGPTDTPYEGGFFYFILQCPPNYPASPPKASIVTTDGGRVRFNPNLYRNGKVCLSILGTWSGPGWSPALSLLSVLLSIQTLLNEKPYHNEPGFEESDKPDPNSEIYNQIIQHETTRVAYLGMINSPPTDLPAGGMPLELKEKILEAAPAYRQSHLSAVSKYIHLSGRPMRDPMNENKGVFRWDKLKGELENL
eukprot:GFUD01034137.1.p1 GENE.GFUD01034137.1~~GFUD01034137.1.p1  ORF type:complete len:1600 (-),score=340.09 GFUD01034137.1:699-5498(-)